MTLCRSATPGEKIDDVQHIVTLTIRLQLVDYGIFFTRIQSHASHEVNGHR